MINPKYNTQVKTILEGKLKRPATAGELVNALTDSNIAMELLLQLHEQNSANIAGIRVAVEKANPNVSIPVVQ